jgi:hypothetical protein
VGGLPLEEMERLDWQLSHPLNAPDERRQGGHLTPGEEIGVAANHHFERAAHCPCWVPGAPLMAVDFFPWACYSG